MDRLEESEKAWKAEHEAYGIAVNQALENGARANAAERRLEAALEIIRELDKCSGRMRPAVIMEMVSPFLYPVVERHATIADGDYSGETRELTEREKAARKPRV